MRRGHSDVPCVASGPQQLHINQNLACYWSQKLQLSRYRGVARSKLEPLPTVGQEAGLLQAKPGSLCHLEAILKVALKMPGLGPCRSSEQTQTHENMRSSSAIQD